MEKKEIVIKILKDDDLDLKADGFNSIAEVVGILNVAIHTLLSGAVDKHISV